MSSGNHAAAVALAAKLRGIPAHIVIPRNAPACKVENVKRYGGHIIWSDASIESREYVCKRVQEETGAVLIHPFNSKYTIRPVVRDLVDDVIVVDDTAIVDAMKMCYEILKVAVEPSGAIGLAAALSDEFKQSSAWHESSKIGIIVSGGNVDLGTLWQSMYKH
ncbi:Serine racemase [Zea mays]|uniref:Serine racemase n=1 Tax=Zea mays TaxID=4577 RepID=A0A1D6E3N3_MAIZE|nr:Serine racemase [Zea mays]